MQTCAHCYLCGSSHSFPDKADPLLLGPDPRAPGALIELCFPAGACGEGADGPFGADETRFVNVSGGLPIGIVRPQFGHQPYAMPPIGAGLGFCNPFKAGRLAPRGNDVARACRTGLRRDWFGWGWGVIASCRLAFRNRE